MISVKDYESMSYRQLQTTAKNLKVPANLKKCYLIELLIARDDGNESLVRKIIENAYGERVQPIHSAKDKPNRYSDVVMVNSDRLKNSNTELEKLLKAPTLSETVDMDISCKGNENRVFSNLKKIPSSPLPSSGNHHVLRKRKNSRGRPRKTNMDSNAVEVLNNQEYKHGKNNEIFCYDDDQRNICSEVGPSQSKIRKCSESTRLDSSRENYFTSESPDEFINIDSWQSCASLAPDNSNIVDLCMDDSNTCNSNYAELRTKSVANINNEFIHKRDNMNLNHKSYHSTPDSLSYKSQELFEMSNENNNSKNFIVMDRNSKSYNLNADEKNIVSGVNTSSQSNNLKFSNYQPCDGLKISTKFSNSKDFHPHNLQTVTHPRVYPSQHLKNNIVLNDEKLPRLIELNNNMNIHNKKTLQTVEVSDHSYSTPFFNKIGNVDNIQVKNKFEYFGRNSQQFKNPQTEHNPNIFDDVQNIDLRYDISDEISSTLEEYFSSLDIPANSEAASKIRASCLNNSEIQTRTISNDWTNPKIQERSDIPFTPMNGNVTSMVCPICHWLERVVHFEEHIKKQHTKYIFKTQNGILSISVDMKILSDQSQSTQLYFIEHKTKIFMFYLKYKYPDIVQPIILSIPESECNSNNNQFAKFFLQVNNLVKKQEIIWSGTIERMNPKGRPLDIDVFSNRKHGHFDISMRTLDLIPNDIPVNKIQQYLNGCVVDMHIFIETVKDIK